MLSNNSQGSQMLLLKIKALSIFANFEEILGGFLVGFIFYSSIWIIPKRNYPGSTHFPFFTNAFGLNQPEKLFYFLWRYWAHTTGKPTSAPNGAATPICLGQRYDLTFPSQTLQKHLAKRYRRTSPTAMGRTPPSGFCRAISVAQLGAEQETLRHHLVSAGCRVM